MAAWVGWKSKTLNTLPKKIGTLPEGAERVRRPLTRTALIGCATGREGPRAAGLLARFAEDDVGIVEQQRLAGDEIGGGDVFGGLAGVADVLGAGEAFAGGAGGGVGGRAELHLGELHVGDVDREGDARQKDNHHQRRQDDDRTAAGAEPFLGRCRGFDGFAFMVAVLAFAPVGIAEVVGASASLRSDECHYSLTMVVEQVQRAAVVEPERQQRVGIAWGGDGDR